MRRFLSNLLIKYYMNVVMYLDQKKNTKQPSHSAEKSFLCVLLSHIPIFTLTFTLAKSLLK